MTDKKTLAAQHEAGRRAVRDERHEQERVRIEARIDRERNRLQRTDEEIERVNEDLQYARVAVDETEGEFRKAEQKRNEATDRHSKLAGRLASLRGSRKAVSGRVHEAETDLRIHDERGA